MHIFKKLALGLLSPLFIILLFATAFDVGFVRTATHPATVKRLVAESGIYSAVIPNLLNQTKTISTSYGTVSTADPLIAKAANSALPPQFIQQNTEIAIDNVYEWLNGAISQPNFSIDLSGSKTLFANKVADAVESKLSSLPACSAAQSREIAQSGQFDAFNATCSPGGSDPDGIIEQMRSNLANEQAFLASSTISPSQITNGGSSQSVFNGQLKSAPKQYQDLKKTPFILAILTILSGVGIVFLSSTWQKGLLHIGINLVVIGLIILVFSWAFNRAVGSGVAPKIKIDNVALQQNVRSLVTDLAQQIDKNYWYFGAGYAIVGAGAITAAEVFRRRVQPVPAKNQGAPVLESAPPQPKSTKKGQ